jgi:hypothetical protein
MGFSPCRPSRSSTPVASRRRQLTVVVVVRRYRAGARWSRGGVWTELVLGGPGVRRCVCVELRIGAKKNLRSFVLRRFIFAARSLRHLLYAGSVLSRAACLSALVVAFSGQQPGFGFSGRNLCFSRIDQYASSMPNRKIEADFLGWIGMFSLSRCVKCVCVLLRVRDSLPRVPELGL